MNDSERVTYPLAYYARRVANRDGITWAEAVRLLAHDAGARDSATANIHQLSNRLVFQHSDGSLEFTGGMWQP